MKLSESSSLNEGTKSYVAGLECPVCKSPNSSILDKRNYADRIWRRRECLKSHRFTTIETVEKQSDIDDRVTKVRQKFGNKFKGAHKEKVPMSAIDMKKVNDFFTNKEKEISSGHDTLYREYYKE